MLGLLFKLLPDHAAYAHCDVPCGIYAAKPSQLAAATMLKMTQLIKALPTGGSPEEVLQARNSFVRMVMTKEEHGRILKHELAVLWADYFKPEHLEIYPDLHNKFWQSLKLVSKVKQSVDLPAAEELVRAVDEIAEIFADSKKT
jgi:nickel superoxide dismutase